MLINGHGTGNGLYSFEGLNKDPGYVAEGPTATRDVVNADSLKGFFEKFTPAVDPSGKGAMRKLLEELKGDLSQESIDKWIAGHKREMQELGQGQGLAGEAVALVRNRDGTWTVSTAEGESSTFSLLNVAA